jgi:hypothetical protein
MGMTETVRVAVLDTRVSGELPPRQLALVEVALLAELRKLENVSAIGMGEIREMLSIEDQRQRLGCSADEACLAEIGGALGTDEMLVSSIVVESALLSRTMKRRRLAMAKWVGKGKGKQRRIHKEPGRSVRDQHHKCQRRHYRAGTHVQ